MSFHRYLLAFSLTMLIGCQPHDSISSSIDKQFSSSGGKVIDLAVAAPSEWDRVCILGPYSNHETVKEALGFNWPSETLTSIDRNDGISLLVFVQGNFVIAYVEHSRRSGDFSNLSGHCFSRDSAKFQQVDRPAKGWPGLFPANEA